MRKLTALLLSAAISSTSLVPRTSAAQEAGDEATEMARERFNEGVDYFDKRQYEKARLAFLQAYALRAHPAVLLNLAQSELRSNHSPEAAAHFAQYLREHDADSVDAKKGLAQAKTKVVEVKVSSDADEVVVFVDDNEVGRTPLAGSLFLTPGEHVIQGRFEGQVVNVTVDGQAGSTRQASLALGASGAAAAPSHPDEEADSTPAGDKSKVPMKPVEARYEKEGFVDWYADTPWAWGLTLLAVGGITGGVISAIASSNQAASRGHTNLDANGYIVWVSTATGAPLTRDANGNYIDASGNVVPPEQRAPDVSGTQGEIYINYEADRQPDSPYYDPTIHDSPNDVVRFTGENNCMVAHTDATRQMEFDVGCQLWNDANDKAATYQVLSIVGFAVAGASIVALPIYYFLDRDDVETASGRPPSRRASVTPVFAPGYAGLTLVGTF